jgi:hypothetical protein
VVALSPLPPASAPFPTPSTYPDRSTGLTIFGIIEILLGGLCALMIPLMLLGAAFSRKAVGGPMPAGTYVFAICTYFFIAAMLVALGIGSIQARRWARALNLILSCAGLITGVIMTVAMAVMLPSSFLAGMRQASNQSSNVAPPPTGFMAVILTFIIVFFAIIFVVVPLAFLLFFGRKDVAETCKRRDPVERWTDRCPLPVLAVSILLGFGVPYSLVLAVTTPMVPFFGKYVTGLPGAAALILLAFFDGFVAFAFYRQRVLGWWLAVAALSLRLASAIITFRRDDILRAYSKMGWSQTQLNALSANPGFRAGSSMLWWSLAFSIIMLLYLIWIKRYFRE